MRIQQKGHMHNNKGKLQYLYKQYKRCVCEQELKDDRERLRKLKMKTKAAAFALKGLEHCFWN